MFTKNTINTLKFYILLPTPILKPVQTFQEPLNGHLREFRLFKKLRQHRRTEGHGYSDFPNVTLGTVDRQSKHRPAAIHGLPSEINPF